MDSYENFKSKSKFLKLIEQYSNVSGQPTTSGANPGANPGTLPVTPVAGVTTPQGLKAQQDVTAANKKQQAVAKRDAQKEMNDINTKLIPQAKAAMNDPNQRQAAQSQLAQLNTRLQSLQSLVKQPNIQ